MAIKNITIPVKPDFYRLFRNVASEQEMGIATMARLILEQSPMVKEKMREAGLTNAKPNYQATKVAPKQTA